MIKVKGRGKDDLVKGTWRRLALRAEPFVNGRSADCMFRTHNPLHLETYDVSDKNERFRVFCC